MKAAKPVRLLRSRYLKRQMYAVLDDGSHLRSGIILHRVLIGLILISVIAVVLESVPGLNAQYGFWFDSIEFFAVGIFTLEYMARLWVCTEHPPYRGLPHWKARLKFATTPTAIIDLLAVLPFYLAFFVRADLRVILIFRLLRFFKLARYSPGMQSLAEAIYSERRALLACVFILAGLVLVAGEAMHLVEGDVQPDKLGTIPDAMYWAIVTLATVGYGDIVPITPLGKFVASITALFGLAMVALPVAIIANAFAHSIQRKDFVVTWGMLARVPLFSELPASEIAEVMRYLQSLTVEEGDYVVRRGDDATCMYFIAVGSVMVELPDKNVRLDEGHFFGESALVHRARRAANVRAINHVKLLVLDGADLRSLMERKPQIAKTVLQAARDRIGETGLAFESDLIQQEIETAAPAQTDMAAAGQKANSTQ